MDGPAAVRLLRGTLPISPYFSHLLDAASSSTHYCPVPFFSPADPFSTRGATRWRFDAPLTSLRIRSVGTFWRSFRGRPIILTLIRSSTGYPHMRDFHLSWPSFCSEWLRDQNTWILDLDTRRPSPALGVATLSLSQSDGSVVL